MTKISCEKCGKEFNSKSHYTQHQKRKTPCVNESKIKEIIEKSVEEKFTKLCSLNENIVIMPSVAVTVAGSTNTIDTATFDEIKKYYDDTLNNDKSTYKSSNDEPTPIDCISEMISKIPNELWEKNDLSILDPCCGNGNFSIPIIFELLQYHDKKTILEQILEFNDINESRLENVRSVFCSEKYYLQITNHDFILFNNSKKYNSSKLFTL